MSDPGKRRRFQTRTVHPHRPALPEQLSSSVPIFQSSTFRFETNEEFARAIRFDGPGYVYSRGYGNPTIDAFQSAMADLEETESAVGFASGMAAIGTVLGLFFAVAISRPLADEGFEAIHHLRSSEEIDAARVERR